ncbi:glycine cleavage system aminomethyltransferase GcvT [Corynebacterium yudongzhengii]|uniref:Aminomethyltransferase n=1 Tax=Corynebacterium yudongzhengii TaxID=2080740 RepID=A0A2U1T7M8_9CORY|nr:glycine cleavage system aminomethyltransferase GcvT [Corynebacterium yudongzhengii]AWB81531.1 glycine cleavage system aminomethyltransferase GcvT [Corynebacterium yudongzhengii]PWC01898.1 glycine cleavage system aminomethyltransferase GcvT [Corynebacterium yudongzhengii]
MTENQNLRNSPLHDFHAEAGATFTAFGDWNMPLKYDKELEEHKAVRERAGIFDLSHMGEVRVTGPQAAEYLDYVLISKLSTAKVGQAKYSMITAADSGIIDDLITYRLGEEEFLVVPNAANTPAVLEAMNERAANFDVTVTDESTDTALIAIQGPKAESILLELVDDSEADTVREMRYYRCAQLQVADNDALLARTGYTGEDGFEIIVPNASARDIWDRGLEIGKQYDALVCGLAARDSLRLEAAMPLYGNELSREITPVEAGMGRAFAKKETDFVGKQALTDRAPSVVIAGLTSEQRRAARAGAEVYRGDERIGVVTSGQPSPTLGYPVALAHLDPERAEVGTEVEVDIRGRRYPFKIAETPFYSRS